MDKIETYIAHIDDDHRESFISVYEALTSAFTHEPVERKFAWGMPSFYRGTTPVIHIAAMKKHLGVYPGPETIDHFADELTNFKTTKGAIQIPYEAIEQTDTIALIQRIAVWSLKRKQ